MTNHPNPKALRIAVNARLLVGQSLEGLGLYTLEILRELLRQTEHQFLLVTDRQGELPKLPRPVERKVVYPSARHPALFYWWFEWAVPPVLRKWRADVFVSLDNFCSLRTSVPTILAIHDLVYLHLPEGMSKVDLAYYRYFMPRFAARADSLVAVSKATRLDLVDKFDLPENRITIAPNGVRPRFAGLSPEQILAARNRLCQGKPYFIYVGSVHPRKNVDGLIRSFDAFKTASHLPHQLLIVGRMAWQTGATAQALAASEFRDDIHMSGYLDTEALGEAIGGAEVLMLVSFFEGFGVPVIEAFACGVPVIVSNRSSLPEVAGPGAILVDPENEAEIAAAMQALATDAQLRQVLAKAGLSHAQQYNWPASGRIISSEIKRLAVAGAGE